MQELKTLTALVKNILEYEPQARNSDNSLYYFVLQHYGSKYDIDINSMSMPHFLLHLKEYPFPTIESVGRCRRKIVETHPELASNKLVKQAREEREKVFRAYAKGVIE